jgi:phosphate transport system permease protein
MFGFVFINGYEGISLKFLIESPSGTPIGSEGGIYNCIIGSLYFTTLSTFIGLLFSICVSAYLAFYNRNKRIKSIIRLVIGVIGGIPSIVLGLFGYGFLVVYMKLGISIIAGSIVLGTLIFPFMTLRFEKIFGEVDKLLFYSSLSLGIDKTYTFFKIILPITYKEITRTICLGASFSMGATAPILLTGAVYYAKVPRSIFSPAMALPLQLYGLISEGICVENAYKTALVLIGILLCLNFIPIILMREDYYGKYFRNKKS